MYLREKTEFIKKISYEIYSKNFQKWHSLLLKLYSISFLHENLGYYFTSQLKNKIFENAIKAKNNITLWNNKINSLIHYSDGAGGNFLLNCLFFSDDFSCIGMSLSKLDYASKIEKINDVKQFYKLTKFIKFQELNSIEEKLNYIISQTKSQVVWADPRLTKKVQPPEVEEYNFILDGPTQDEIKSHELKIFPNYKTIIYFKNSKLFVQLRKYNEWCWWHTWRNSEHDSIITQDTLLKFIERPQKYKEITIDKFNDTVQINSYCDLNSKATLYVWDTNWYFSEKNTITHIKELYEMLQLSGFDENSISRYYNVWIKTMNNLKTKSLNEVT